FRALCAGLRRPDILDDARWSSPEARVANAQSLRAELVAIFKTDSAATWERTLDAAGVPAAKVRSLDEALAEDHVRSRAVAPAMRWGREPKDIHLPTLGFKVDGAVVAPTRPPPTLGADTAEILR